jgi:glyoxylase-like metal-dependent hydrolase (beta-lactamase superfamily II)
MSKRHDFLLSRRQLLRTTGALAGATIAARMVPDWLVSDVTAFQAAAADGLAQRRTQMAAAPLQTSKLTDRLTMLSGPGGNVVVSTGPDGKLLVDCFVQPAWPALNGALEGLGKGRVTAVIDTHWHFDHMDNNASLRKLGAAVVAHAKTKERLQQSHEILGMKIPPSPAEALPTQTFDTTHTMDANGEQLVLTYVPPAHTDTDITVRFAKSNVLHMGDLFFNGGYPFFDTTTGGRINGMIAAADAALKIVDAQTKIVPGHGPLADRAALTRSRDVMVAVRDRVQKLKSAGRTLEETIAAAPSKEFDAEWGQGFMDARSFVTLVYQTL